MAALGHGYGDRLRSLRAIIYPAAEIGRCHETAAGMDLIHLDQTVCERTDHVRGVV